VDTAAATTERTTQAKRSRTTTPSTPSLSLLCSSPSVSTRSLLPCCSLGPDRRAAVRVHQVVIFRFFTVAFRRFFSIALVFYFPLLASVA